MRQTWIIARKELMTFFDSLMAYILIVIFLGLSGLFTWILGRDIFFVNQASLQVFFRFAYIILFLFIPALTMKLLAEERKTGTLELLITKPVSDWQVVWGKFLAALLLIFISFILTLPYYISVSQLGPVDHGAVLTGYLGLLLMSSSYIGVGLFASSISNNQIISFLVALLIGVFFFFLTGILANVFKGWISNVFNYLSMQTHFDSISRGVVDSKDLIYFLSILFLGLFSTQWVLAKRTLS